MSFGAAHTKHRTNIESKFVLVLALVLASGSLAIYTFWHMQASLVAPLLVVLGVGLLASAAAHYSLFRPVRQLAAMARAIGHGDLSKRLDFKRHDEIGTLAFEMDTMCNQLEAGRRAAEAHIVALEQLRHSDRIATLGRLASSVAHELGTPLSVIELRAQLIMSGDAGGLRKAQLNAAVIVEQAERMTGIIDQVLSFARVQPAQLSRVDLVSVLRKAISLTDHIAKQHRTGVQLEVHRVRVELLGDSDKLLQVVVNLIVNGLQAGPVGGTLRMRTRDVMHAPDDHPDGAQSAYVCVEVLDEGPGIAAPVLARVFEPFFSTRHADGGTGLGLSVAQGIAREHEGWIVASSEPDEGACFKLYLPQQRARRQEITESTDASQTAVH